MNQPNLKLIQRLKNKIDHESGTLKKGLFWEARSRILMWYVLLLLGFIGLSIPVFSYFVFQEVDQRVRQDLEEDLESFETFLKEFTTKASTTNNPKEELSTFFEQLLLAVIPEDDTFLITIIDGKFYRSSPRGLPKPMQKDSALMNHWQDLTQNKTLQKTEVDSEIGKIIYIAKPIILQEEISGVFVVAHVTTGEKQEALDAIIITIEVLFLGLILAIFLAWIASGKVLIPLQKLAIAAQQIGESDLTRRIIVQGSGEIAELGIAFNQMMDRLQTSFESQQNFLNDAGHELRTPITIIRGHLELMGDDPQDQQETITLVLDELDRMARLVDDLSLLAKAERPDFLQLEMIDISDFTEELYLKAIGLKSRHWLLENKAKGQLMIDRQRITQAIMNLAQNASQHTRESDQITIGSTEDNHFIRLWVKDTGQGINKQDQQRIFNRFVRLNVRSSSEGSGLGLSIVKAIAEAHGGRVELISEIGEGSIFTIILPKN
ncbi:histidine kinase [Rippkaea orientalis PCC 8801]|uniref:histidine kinase n=1 Tax=Rippkaea orientalis (strain PCC 8801 / RF-1) TaxID=41431 RepID=B7K0K6_RIPO1|nr:HAMP domain-containing sensor histidine kinase [Rippkaea orientalis]ACK67490.1 histidine kinase [Rippkaea orientalis PCC 8801]